MKLCILGDTNSPHVVRWAKYFVDHSWDVSIVTINEVSSTIIKNVMIYTIKTNKRIRKHGRLCAALNINQFRKIINEIQPDLIHAHDFRVYGLLASWLNTHPFIISAWGSDVLIHINKSRIQKYLVQKAIRNADLLHVDGIKTWETLENLGASKEKIVLIYFGTDTNNFSPQKRCNDHRNKLRIGSSLMIISTRALRPIYNVETLIHAIPKVLNSFPDAKFVIVGSGPQKEALHKLVKDLKVDNNTIFTGRFSDSDLPHYIASADIYVSTALSDAGISACTAEAMACGLPVIATEDIDNRDWIEDGVNGFIIPVKKPDILANRIVELIKNNELRNEMGVRNRGIIIERNNYLTEMNKMEKVYMDLKK